MTFCLNCCCKVGGEPSFDSPYRACGSGGLANSLGGANCVPYARNALASFPGPRPACSTLAQLPVACSTVTASDGKLC